jgi:hypothetical protein
MAGKVTAVVAVMHLYSDSNKKLVNRITKTSAKKTKLGSRSKNLDLKRSNKRLKEDSQPPEVASERLLVKQTTIRVLLDTGSSGDLLFLKKDLRSRFLLQRGLFQSHGALPTAPVQQKRWVTLRSPSSTIPRVKRCACTLTLLNMPQRAQNRRMTLSLANKPYMIWCGVGLQRKDHHHRQYPPAHEEYQQPAAQV